jgi:exocyst complex component 2
MHAEADTQQLLNGLDVLSQSIDQKSASLKVLVESNFERFVRAKATIDNVYKEMKYRGVDPTPRHSRTHSRHASRSSFRGSGANGGPSSHLVPVPDSRKKNALVKESDYGVLGIKAPLLDVSAKAEDVWGPALGGREKEEHLKDVAANLEKFKQVVEISSAISDSIKRNDQETLIEEYVKARRFADEARQVVQAIGSTEPTEEQVYRILLTGRMWHDVDQQIQAFKRDVWRKLASLHTASKADSGPGQTDQHMELISLLLELGVEDNPIWVWLLSRYDYLKGKILATADRSKVEIEVLRRRLASAERPGPDLMALHMKALGRQSSMDSKAPTFDNPDIIEMWEKVAAFMTAMLSSDGILGEVLEFWRTVQGFIDGKTQRTLPAGYKGESETHHRLSQQGTIDLQKGTVELVDLLREHILSFFAGPPPEDISALFSPLPSTPNTPMAASTRNGSLSPLPRDPRFAFDANNQPPPSPKRGEFWEKYAFWPPWSNAVSGVHYISKLLVLVGTGAADMAYIAPVARGEEVEHLRALVSTARDRSIRVLCAAWNEDSERFKYLEDWERPLDRKDVTKMPTTFATFENALLTGMQSVLYIPEATAKPGADHIVLPPSRLNLDNVRGQFFTTLYKALSGMVEIAERRGTQPEDDWTIDADDFVIVDVPEGGKVSLTGNGTKLDRVSRPVLLLSTGHLFRTDLSDQSSRMLLTLSNFHVLRSQIIPGLVSQFENAFAVTLTDQTEKVRNVLNAIDDRLFQAYTKSAAESLQQIIHAGVTAPNWVPEGRNSRPREVNPYVYEALLTLVLIHSQVSTTTSSLTTQILSYLLETASQALLDAFKIRPRYNLEALMQATLDVEFVAQSLSQFTTDKASEIQGLIYQELDSRTDNEARAKLQGELPEMRAVLKRLRKASENEFACFRKPRRPKDQASSNGSNRAPSVASNSTGTTINPGPLRRVDTGQSEQSL